MVSNYNVSETPTGYKVDVVVRIHNKDDENELFKRLNEIDELTLMKLD